MIELQLHLYYDPSSNFFYTSGEAYGQMYAGMRVELVYNDDVLGQLGGTYTLDEPTEHLQTGTIGYRFGDTNHGAGHFSVDTESVNFDYYISELPGDTQVSLSNDVNFYWTNVGVNDVSALGGDDVIYTGGGNDRISGGAGRDFMDGGSGADTLDYMSSSAGVAVNLATNTAHYGDAEGDTIVHFERVLGSMSDDTLLGNASVNLLKGYQGDDALYGGDGDDVLNGGSGKDTLEGQQGADQLFGEAANDKFVFRTLDASTVSSDGRDVIMDFSHDQKDLIHLAYIDANTQQSGDQAFAFIDAQAFHSVAGELRYQLNGADATVFGDVDGDAVADFAIDLHNVASLVAADFVL